MNEQDREDRLAEAAKVVPFGMYCYTRVPDPDFDVERKASGQPYIPGRTVRCPYHEIRQDKPQQENGYCRLLQLGDWMEDGTMLLWDGCKECDVNMPSLEDLMPSDKDKAIAP